ncbi:hypothetical protein ENSA5_43250 [Enhygromyxa salina]|uniref:Uncharacterized protein n=1 Tax=Enhygromyxa salina TaxID=215803 RepID=A0A2S9XKC1_9BACT|nr:hypothetical protein [Enhygromyxa salina]PRP93303.1 hypothetical protein ENSA5_43250 [Enhygromyxa salina]
MDERAPEAEDDESREAERRRVIAAIEAGMADSRAGRTMTHAQLVARMEARFAERSK